jgi:tetratricopeptide (TPR) repeat protein
MQRALRRRLVCLVWLAGVCLLPRLALADAAAARAHFDRGRTFFEVDEYRKAIGEFKAAHIEKPDPAFLYNIAECYRRLGEVPEALQFYRRYLATAPADDKTRPVVEQRIAELKTVADEPKTTPTETGNLALDAPGATPGEPPAVLVDKPAAVPPPAESPFYTQPWFLVTVGVVAAASVVGIWALSRAPGPPATPLGNQSIF